MLTNECFLSISLESWKHMLPLSCVEKMVFLSDQNSHVAKVILYKPVFSVFISKENIWKNKTTSHLALWGITTNDYC